MPENTKKREEASILTLLKNCKTTHKNLYVADCCTSFTQKTGRAGIVSYTRRQTAHQNASSFHTEYLCPSIHRARKHCPSPARPGPARPRSEQAPCSKKRFIKSRLFAESIFSFGINISLFANDLYYFFLVLFSIIQFGT